MSYNNISASIPAEEKTEIANALQTVKSKLPFLINLTPKERQKMRTMGAVRTSYVQDVQQASVSNSSSLPRDFDLEEYGKDLQLYRDMREILNQLLPIFEGIESTTLALSAELMKQTDQCYAHLKVEAKKSNNAALSETIKRIAVQLKQQRKTEKLDEKTT